jgi:hypothetical protein
LGLSDSASAQEESTSRYEIGLNYSWLHVNPANDDYQRTGNGGSGYFLYNLTPMVGLVGDFGGYANTRTAINEKALKYLFGPVSPGAIRVGTRMCNSCSAGHTRGVARTIIPTNKRASRWLPAVGLDYVLTNHIAIKPIPLEYVMTQFDSANLGGSTQGFGSHQNDLRYSAGVVFRLGEK